MPMQSKKEMSPLEVRNRFMQIYRHEFDLSVDASQSLYCQLSIIKCLFQDTGKTSINYIKIQKAIDYFNRFCLYLTVIEAVEKGELICYWNEEATDYYYKRAQQEGNDSELNEKENNRHLEYIQSKIQEVINGYISIVEEMKKH